MLRLFHSPGSCSLAPLAALGLAGAHFAVETVDLAGDRRDFRRLVPSGRVPALSLDGELVTENVAILYRIASLFPDARLLPEEPAAVARQLSLMAWLASTAHIARRQFRVPSRFTPDLPAQEALRNSAWAMVSANMHEMERRLGAAEWFGGDTVGVSDCHALVFLDWAARDNVDLAHLAALKGWRKRILQLPAIGAALEAHGSPLTAG